MGPYLCHWFLGPACGEKPPKGSEKYPGIRTPKWPMFIQATDLKNRLHPVVTAWLDAYLDVPGRKLGSMVRINGLSFHLCKWDILGL